MDLSIVSRDKLARMRKVQGLSTSAQGVLTSLGQRKSCALATALASCADTPCGQLSLNELAMVMAHRFVVPDALTTVDQHSLFALWVAIDDELQRRKDESEPPTEQLVEDVPPMSPFASAVGIDDADHMELEAYAVRSIHAEILGTEDFPY